MQAIFTIIINNVFYLLILLGVSNITMVIRNIILMAMNHYIN